MWIFLDYDILQCGEVSHLLKIHKNWFINAFVLGCTTPPDFPTEEKQQYVHFGYDNYSFLLSQSISHGRFTLGYLLAQL